MQIVVALEDIKSGYKGTAKQPMLLYCKKGDKLKVVSEHDNVLIVSDINGNKFPIKRELCKLDKKELI
jgi:SH3-like domain-containing protein